MIQDAARDLFRRHFQGEPEGLVLAPGRVNLIGEHTDYNDGFVFPAAIDRGIALAFRKTTGATRLVSDRFGEAVPFDASSTQPKEIGGWGGYAAGVAWALESPLPNLEGAVVADLPDGSGVSSSAALELAFAVAWNEAAAQGHPNSRLAALGQKAENQYVGVNCGIMDQMASAMGRAGHAMFLDTRTLEIRYAPIPEGLVMVLCDTKTSRELAASAYNVRRSECMAAAEVLGVPALRDASMALLVAKKEEMSDVVFRRARHVVSENARCLAFAEALEARDLAALGQLMRASHESLRDDYEVTSDALNYMAEAAWEAPGCVGARMTGAGFGGACIALVHEGSLDAFMRSVSSSYLARSGREGELMACKAADGARLVTPD